MMELIQFLAQAVLVCGLSTMCVAFVWMIFLILSEAFS